MVIINQHRINEGVKRGNERQRNGWLPQLARKQLSAYLAGCASASSACCGYRQPAVAAHSLASISNG